MRGDGYDALYEWVGGRLAQARRSAKLSQEVLASRVGLTRASIVNIERGRQRPPLHLLWQLAALCSVDPLSLLPTQDQLEARASTVELTPKVLKAIETAATSDPETRRLVTEFIQKATARIEATDGRTNA